MIRSIVGMVVKGHVEDNWIMNVETPFLLYLEGGIVKILVPFTLASVYGDIWL